MCVRFSMRTRWRKCSPAPSGTALKCGRRSRSEISAIRSPSWRALRQTWSMPIGSCIGRSSSSAPSPIAGRRSGFSSNTSISAAGSIFRRRGRSPVRNAVTSASSGSFWKSSRAALPAAAVPGRHFMPISRGFRPSCASCRRWKTVGNAGSCSAARGAASPSGMVRIPPLRRGRGIFCPAGRRKRSRRRPKCPA